MTSQFKQQVLVENAAGAGGTIGTQKVASAKPDGGSIEHHSPMILSRMRFVRLPSNSP